MCWQALLVEVQELQINHDFYAIKNHSLDKNPVPPAVKLQISSKKVREYLGVETFKRREADNVDRVGVTNGLAWTSAGGEGGVRSTLTIIA